MYIYRLSQNLVEYDVIHSYLFWDIEIFPYDIRSANFISAQ